MFDLIDLLGGEGNRLSSSASCNIAVAFVATTAANCVAVAAAGAVTSYPRSSDESPTTPVDSYDEYAILSRLHQAANITSSASFRPPSYCTVASQMRPGPAPRTQQQTAPGVVRGGALHGGQATIGPGPAVGQTALPYTVGFALSPGDMMRQPALTGFQGSYSLLSMTLQNVL